MSRQNYYKQRKIRNKIAFEEQTIITLVRRERCIQPRLGTRKLHRLLGEQWASAGISIGRDRLFALLRRHHLLIRRRRRYARTTDSRHGLPVYPNRFKEAVLTGPNQAWVSDITYLRTRQGFMYLSLVMDAFSRKIVGYNCSDRLESEGALRALSMALNQLPLGADMIHHSDQGCQYCSRRYIERLLARNITISMTQENHCYENSQAERLNGILKHEYGLGGVFLRKSDVVTAVHQAVQLYNDRRPHVALGYCLPTEVHAAA
jgi:transposase InsO family protein